MVERMEASLGKIHETARALGESRGFDWVVDASGKTNTGLPLMLYAKDPPDLTDEVIAALTQPTETTPPAPETAAGNPR